MLLVFCFFLNLGFLSKSKMDLGELAEGGERLLLSLQFHVVTPDASAQITSKSCKYTIPNDGN